MRLPIVAWPLETMVKGYVTDWCLMTRSIEILSPPSSKAGYGGPNDHSYAEPDEPGIACPQILAHQDSSDCNV